MSNNTNRFCVYRIKHFQTRADNGDNRKVKSVLEEREIINASGTYSNLLVLLTKLAVLIDRLQHPIDGGIRRDGDSQRLLRRVRVSLVDSSHQSGYDQRNRVQIL